MAMSWCECGRNTSAISSNNKCNVSTVNDGYDRSFDIQRDQLSNDWEQVSGEPFILQATSYERTESGYQKKKIENERSETAAGIVVENKGKADEVDKSSVKDVGGNAANGNQEPVG
ncbi:unnamed protein product [Thelazia callipaeda]|uniref:DUF1521 domain-containing protein n=1 Tax=Thelazia callipaeda TaxID=103827 RepID=A0A0N5D8W7_THECL|nr:unnamed protein product [Thelazia callipaeda]